jgi:hypothetical protein
VVSTYITVLLEDLVSLVSAVPSEARYPALERVYSRGRPCRSGSLSPDHLRFDLFGIRPDDDLPIAALTHVNDGNSNPQNDYFWLRTDPVTMWADMARVFMTSYGFADLNPFERNEIENCIRSVLQEEGIELRGDHPERWCIALDKPLDFEFTPLDHALGMDVAEALPEHPEARYWRRILNEIQVALHHCPVNEKRRLSGKQEINSVWFWGGGFIPDAAPHDLFDTVYSNHPVTRGLAIINDCRLKRKAEAEMAEFGADGRSILVDWSLGARGPDRELERIEGLVRVLLEKTRTGEVGLSLYQGNGEGRIYDRGASRRFWRRSRPLARAVPAAAET